MQFKKIKTRTKQTKIKLNLRNKFSNLFLAVFLLSFITLGTVAWQPKPAQAVLGVGDVSVTVGDVPATIFRTLDKIWRIASEQLLNLAKLGLITAVDSYVQQFAYEAALQAATGSPGQDPLVYNKPLLAGLADAGNAALGDYLDKLSRDVFGQSLCEPLNPDFKLKLSIILERQEKPVLSRSTCSLSDIGNNIVNGDHFRTTSQSFKDLDLQDSIKFSSVFDSRQSELGSVVLTRQIVEKVKADAKDAEKTNRLIGQGYKDALNQTGTSIKTSAADIRNTIAEAMGLGADKSIPDKPNDGDLLLQILSRGLNTFSRTFLGAWTDQLFKKGLNTRPTAPSDSQSYASSRGVSGARKYFSKLKEFKPIYINTDIDISSQLASCPPNSTAREWNHCRIGRGTKQAIDQQLTLKEAIDQGLINGEAIFGYDHVDGSYPRYDQGFPYPSLVILRKYRVIPVGWEIAAEYIENIQATKENRSISYVMNCYEDPLNPTDNTLPANCRVGGVNPFYHLVNPNWLLKAPETKCYQEGPGPELVYEQSIEVPIESFAVTTGFNNSDGTIEYETKRIIARGDYCADERGCIQEDADGNCLFWGHCVAEKPIWRFTAESCPAQFNTCQTLNKVEGAYKSNSGSGDVSYLTNTLKSCPINNVGCGWYSTYQDPLTGEWEGNIDLNGNGADRIYLNNNFTTCAKGDVGCTMFYKAPDNSDPVAAEALINSALSSGNYGGLSTMNLRKAPDYLGCDGANPPSACNDYALSCTADDMGCMYYNPLNGDPKIPAKITDADLCSEQCVGFSTFTYQPSWFETAEGDASVAPVNIVPSTAEQCSQAGCEAFTNVGTGQLEYYTQLQACITPGSGNTKTYFTWEGSDTSGYQLKRWVILAGSNGAPCTAVDPGSATTCSETLTCNIDSSPTCLTFFDEAGSQYNADISSIIYASDNCRELRREISGTTYYAEPSFSQSCSAENVDCREYRGAASNNVQILFANTFDGSGSVEEILSGWSGGTVSSESISVNGHSLSYSGTVSKSVAGYVATNRWYTISFIAKGGSANFSFSDNVSNVNNFPSVGLSAEWQYYQIGPVQITHTVSDQEVLQFSGSGYIDNIVLRANDDNYLFKKNAPNDISAGDTALAGQCAAEGGFNCQLYQPDLGATVALKSFSQLCEDKFIGCIPVINSQNSTQDYPSGAAASGSYTWAGDGVDVTVNDTYTLDDFSTPADAFEYIVDDPNKYCSSAARGCTLVAQPTFDRQLTESGNFSGCSGANCPQEVITSFTERTIIINPDTLPSTMCGVGSLFCSLYTNPNSNTEQAFVDPGNRTCEYLESGSQGAGWYESGTENLCYGVGYDQLEPVLPLDINNPAYQPYAAYLPTDLGNPAYGGWVGYCPDTYSSCSQLIDPEVHDPFVNISQDGEGIYYVLHDQLNSNSDISDCIEEGIVDREVGCRLFADTYNYSTNIVLGSELAYDWTLSPDGSAPQSAAPTPGLGIASLSNTANILVKVKPDRVCSEFLSCVSSLTLDNQPANQAFGNSSNGQQSICLGIGLCTRLDASGKCMGNVDIFTQSETATMQNASSNLDLAEWGVGMNRVGMSWPNGGFTGLYSYHQMSEVGVPITLPNSNFEDKKNFGKEYSSWPDVTNARIIGDSAGIFPYEGSYMLELEVDSNNPGDDVSVTSTNLPSSPGLETAISFYVNFDVLRQDKQGICVAGHIDNIGDGCSSDAECSVGTNTCTQPLNIVDFTGYCKAISYTPVYTPIYTSCSTDAQCSSGAGTCGQFVCSGNYSTSCDPYRGVGVANTNTDCASAGGYCTWIIGSSSTIGPTCTNGDASKIGSKCVTNGDCAATGSNLCRPVGSIMKVEIIGGTTQVIDVVVDGKTGWQQFTAPFIMPNTDTFKVRLFADNSLGAVGSIMVDNVEIRSGLKISETDIVAPSCRLYPRTDGLETDALACDYVDRGNISGNEITTYKGWRGYCVEEVPDEPGVCMNWWPVDVVQGDVNLFGSAKAIDIDYASDLYYCLHSTGDVAANATSYTAGTCIDNPNSSEDFPPEPVCNDYDTDPVTCNATVGCAYDATISECRSTSTTAPLSCGDFPDVNSCLSNGDICIWNWDNGSEAPPTTYTYKTNRYSSSCAEVKDRNFQSGQLEVDNLNIYRSQIANIAIVWDDNCDQDRSWPSNGEKFILTPDRDDPYLWSVYKELQTNNEPDSFTAEARFNRGSKLLEQFYVELLDPNGGYVGGTFHFEVYLRDICQTITRVNTSYGARTPWVDRFKNSSFEQPDLNLFYADPGQDSAPFGAIVPPAGSEGYEPFDGDLNNPWLLGPIYGTAPGKTTYCSGDYLPQQCSRAGSAYSCDGNCGSSRVCIAGSAEELGKSCVVHDDCVGEDEFGNTTNAKGLCGGYSGNALELSIGSTPWAMDHGIQRLRQLFAKSYGIYGWDYVLEQYIKCDSLEPFAEMPAACGMPDTSLPTPAPFTDTKVIPIDGSSHRVYILDNYDITGCGWTGGFKFNNTSICSGVDSTGKSPEVNNFYVNGQEGNITIQSGDFVTLQFYPSVDGNRQPLKAMRIDWGDGTPYQPNQDLTNLAGEGLPAQTYFFVHQYVSDPDPGFPRIQLKDNWGWCTGGQYQCGSGTGSAWVQFPGNITVQ